MRELLVEFKNLKGDYNKWLKDILNVKIIDDYSEFFKFLTGAVKIHPDSLDIVIERIQAEWQNSHKICDSAALFKGTVSFLGRLKKTVRRQEFNRKISKLWPIIFNFPGQDRLKLHLVREYRRELPFGWLYEFTLRDEFFYNENLNVEAMDAGGMAVIDILMELLDKSRGDDDFIDELRVSGLLEKIGSLWRSPALISPESRIVKLLAMASLISGSNIFDSLQCLMTVLITVPVDIWTVRLVESILRKYPKRQYVLSQSRAELNVISKEVIQITTKSIDSYAESAEMNKTVCGLVKSVLERWEGMACSCESEIEFCTKVAEFLEISYKSDSNDFGYNLLNVFAKEFIDPLLPQISFFFRNSLKSTAKKSNEITNLSFFTNILVNDGGTDRDFPLLFKEHPSLVFDVHELLSIKGNEMNRFDWLLTLADSSRTRNVLINFLIDPKQINEIESNQFWINFMGRLTRGIEFEKINQWTNGKLLSRFLERAKGCDPDCFDDYFYDLLKIVIERLKDIDDIDLLFILTITKTNIEIFNWILCKFDCKLIILNNLIDFIPFGNSLAMRVYEILKGNLLSIDELISCLFQSRDRDADALIKAMAQWNLLIESNNLNFVEETNKEPFFTKDYGNYLEILFEGIQNTKTPLIKESNDPIEMYLEYYKYGQIRSMLVLQKELLSLYRCSELLLRIPLAVLRASGPDFGGIILDSILTKGWELEDLDVIMSSTCSDYNFDLLKVYYKTRINKQ